MQRPRGDSLPRPASATSLMWAMAAVAVAGLLAGALAITLTAQVAPIRYAGLFATSVGVALHTVGRRELGGADLAWWHPQILLAATGLLVVVATAIIDNA